MYTKEQREMILRQHQEGKNVTEICAEYNVSKSSLYNWLRQDRPVKSQRKTSITCRMYYELEQEVLRLREEVEILHRAGRPARTSVEQKLPELVRLNTEYGYSVHALCRALEVRRSAFYHYTLRRPEQTVFQRDAEQLKLAIAEIFNESKCRFGSRMIRVKLMERGYTASQVRIAALMKELELVCNAQKKTLQEYRRVYQYSGHAFAVNKLKRQFTQTAPNLVWVSDLTYLRTLEAVYYLCVILDLFSRKVISYTLSDSKAPKIVTNCFQRAYEKRQPPDGLMFHSDQGAKYYSSELRDIMNKHCVVQSFSNVGTPYENAVV
ncbi:MAG: hypothetical protein CVU91_12330 [Firmicutes bacterium HGW-Firmicutes-16]|nr:MAG: hypothetical protein CVU91_12330 [Firmicutes bacterium HGW-Firmicutes-16]